MFVSDFVIVAPTFGMGWLEDSKLITDQGRQIVQFIRLTRVTCTWLIAGFVALVTDPGVVGSLIIINAVSNTSAFRVWSMATNRGPPGVAPYINFLHFYGIIWRCQESKKPGLCRAFF